MQPIRHCGECTVCCYVGEVKENIVNKSACSICPFLDHGCTLFGKPERPQHHCTDFLCSWLRGYGADNDRPDKSGVMVSVNHTNGGTWIFAMETQKDGLKTGKNILIDIAAKVDLPVIIVDHRHLKTSRGDYVIVKKSLEPRSSKIMGEFLETYSDTMNLYKLIIR